MAPPKWNDPDLKAGTMVRTALWLIEEIGVGNSFTKERHRHAFSGVAQADRRMRDLRDYGWVVHTNLEDLTLNSNEQRLVSIGLPVWEPGVRKQATATNLTAKMRMEIFSKNDYQCVICGIAGGENYPDSPQTTAVLLVSRSSVVLADGRTEMMFATECKRCRAGSTSGSIDLNQLVDDICDLGKADREVFERWSTEGGREALERVWANYRRLSDVSRSEIRKMVSKR